jgi:hypothetical protein
MPFRAPPIIVRGPAYAAIRAFRSESRDDLVRRQNAFLGTDQAGQESRLRRALRKERAAAVAGKNYDLARHFALARLCNAGALRASVPGHTCSPETEPGAVPCPKPAAPKS